VIIFSLLIRFVLENYLEMLLCIFTNLFNFRMDSFARRFSLVFSTFLLVILIASPPAVYYFLYKNKGRLSQDKMAKFGSLFDGIDIQ